MLGKLVKYDLKYGFRIFIIIHAILMIACTLGRFLFLNKIDFHTDPAALSSLLIIFASLFALLFTAVCFGVGAMLVVRFYKNLFTDEGYLTWTLPAAPTQQLWAKIISGTIWYVLDILLCVISLLILVTGKNVTTAYASVAPDINQALGMSVSNFGLYLLALTLFGTIPCLIVMYLSIAIGQLFPGHRILCAIVTYFIITCALQVTTFALMFSFNIVSSHKSSMTITISSPDMSQYMFSIFKLGVGVYLFVAIAGYFGLHYIMNKKINLL